MKYSFDSRVRYSEIGEDGRLTLNALINYFQDCSTFQSEDIGQGVGVLKSSGRAWVLSAWQIHIGRYPLLGECIRTGTWACGFKGCLGSRNFIMETEGGERLASALSAWAYVDTGSGALARIPEDVVLAYGKEPALEETFGSRKIPVPADAVCLEPFPVRPHHLDTNHHVNNGQFVSMAAEYLPEGRAVRQLRAEYRRQAHLGDVLTPRVAVSGEVCTVALADEKSAPYAVVEFR